MLKDCLAQKLELSSDTFQAHIEVIYQCLMQTNQLVLLDVRLATTIGSERRQHAAQVRQL